MTFYRVRLKKLKILELNWVIWSLRSVGMTVKILWQHKQIYNFTLLE